MSLSVSGFFTQMWDQFKTQEELAVLEPLANAFHNYALNTTPLNFMLQMTAALTQIQAKQPAIIQAEIQAISDLLAKAAAAVATHVPPPAA